MASRYFIHSSKGLDGRHLINITENIARIAFGIMKAAASSRALSQ